MLNDVFFCWMNMMNMIEHEDCWSDEDVFFGMELVC